MMDFFPINPGQASWNTSIEQTWSVEEARTASGKRRTLVQQTYPEWNFSLSFPQLSKRQVDDLLNFYAKMRGSWASFLYKDYENNHCENVELLKQGDDYYCKTNLATMFEPCYGVENLHVYVNGQEVHDYIEDKGMITFENDVEGTVTATYDYFYLVAFGNSLKVAQLFHDLYSVDLQLTVVRE